MKNHIFIFFLLIASTIASAQVPTDLLQAKSLLASKGITEQELKDNLAGKGIDVDNISPEDLPSLQGTIEQAVAEIEAEKGLTVNNELSKENLEDKFEKLDEVSTAEVGVKVETGASVEEAISDIKADHTNTEKASPIYGHSIFFDNTLDFYKTTQTSSTPDHYILDVGDKITINIFGKSQADLIYQIENDGFIRPKGMYKINLKGVQFGKAKELLFKRFQQAYIFNNGQFNLEVTSARTITVNIFGAVQNPGSYTISSLNNALHAILAAGGPTKNGSVRAIRVLNGSKEYTIDVYEFLTNPKKAEGYGLQNNSVIFIPPIQNLVNLTGPFTHTGNFELLPKENIADLLKIAGGVRKNTVLANYNIIRNNGLQDNLFTYDYQLTKKMVLEDLDRVVFKSTEKEYQNYVSITGAVRFGGHYELSESLSIADLLTKAKLEEFARTDLAYLTRKNIDGTYQLLSLNLNADNSTFKLQKEDGIVIFDQRTFVEKYTFSLSGAVRQPLDSHFLDPNKTIRFSDAILLAGGVKDQATAFAYVTGRNINSGKKVSYKLVDIAEALANPGSSADIVIQPYDQITIPSVADFQEELFVEVRGAVKNPQKLRYDSTLTLTDLLLKAGGLTIDAASNKVDIFRLLIQDNVPTQVRINSVSINRALDLKGDGAISLQPFDIVVVRKVPDFKLIRTVTVEGEVKYPGQYPITKDRETLADILAKAGGITDEAYLFNSTITRSYNNVGRITIDFKKALKRKKNKNHNVVVLKNDVIVIGKKQDIVLVDVSGTRAQEFVATTMLNSDGKVASPYFKGKRAGYYIKEYAGGFDNDAKRAQTYVKDLDGRFKKTHNFLLFRVHRIVKNGSEIVISGKKANKIEERRNRKKEESKVNLKDTVTEILTLMISAFTVITLSNNL